MLEQSVLNSSNISDTPLEIDSDFFHDCEQILVELIGPIASVICQQTLKQNPRINRSKFIEIVLNKLADRERKN